MVGVVSALAKRTIPVVARGFDNQAEFLPGTARGGAKSVVEAAAPRGHRRGLRVTQAGVGAVAGTDMPRSLKRG
jgi:hypothetical protein